MLFAELVGATVEHGTMAADPPRHTEQRQRGRGQLRRHAVQHSKPDFDMPVSLVRADQGPGQVAEMQVGNQQRKCGAAAVVQSVRVG